MNHFYKSLLGVVIGIALLANCRGGATPSLEPGEPPTETPTVTATVTETSEDAQEDVALQTLALAPFDVNLDAPFAQFEASSWEPTPYQGLDYSLPLDYDLIVNRFVLNGLTEAQDEFLLEHGFVVMHSQENQFSSIRGTVSKRNGQPYYLTTDAAFHALHLTFDDLLKALEKEQFGDSVIEIAQATLTELQGYVPELEGSVIEADLEQAIAYLSVALKLLDPDANIDASVAEIVDAQIAQIMAEGGKQDSVLFPDFEDDYGAYRPVGHYAGDSELEAYFRAMNWLGRVNIPLKDEESSRLPLLVTLALRRAKVGRRSAADAWTELDEVLAFLIGPTDDPGPPEFAALMDEVYGTSLTAIDLADEALWTQFVTKREGLPQPGINSLFVDYLEDAEELVGWRFLGQRFTIDAFILQNLIFDNVGAKPNGDKRWLPTGPDVMAALGSEAAMDILLDLGEDEYLNYLDQMTMLQDTVKAQTPEQWRSVFYDAWLYSFLPVLSPKGDSYPNVMNSQAWAVREMNTCLGSWAELKHDTILYVKMPEGAGGGGPPCSSDPPPGYVEANPEAFYRMAYVASIIAEGLDQRGIAREGSDWCFPGELDGLKNCMAELGERFAALGDLAAKELAGEILTGEEYALIQSCLGVHECMSTSMDPVPIIAAVAGGNPGILEVATGYVDRIFIVVPLDGRFYVAQGGVYSYYEFVQPRTDRLTDEAWRERLDGPNAPSLPSWSDQFVLSGGSSTDVTGFYIGAAYEVTEQGIGVEMREEAGFANPVVFELEDMYTLLKIVDGPVEADGYTWWQFEDCFTGKRGWALQDGRWFSYYVDYMY